MRVYNTALEQTRDNLKTLLRTITSYIKADNRRLIFNLVQ